MAPGQDIIEIQMDDNSKGRLTQFLGTFNHDSLRTQRFVVDIIVI